MHTHVEGRFCYDRKYAFFIALREKRMKHEGHEDAQRTRRDIYLFRVLHILHSFVFKMLFLNLHKRVNVFLYL